MLQGKKPLLWFLILQTDYRVITPYERLFWSARILSNTVKIRDDCFDTDASHVVKKTRLYPVISGLYRAPTFMSA